MRGSAPLRAPRDLAGHTWLESVHWPGAWPEWLRAAGIDEIKPRRRRVYDNAQLMLDAAIAGQGIALASTVVADRHLQERRLVRPFPIVARSPRTYHLVARPEDLEKPQIRAFTTWIRAEMDAWSARAAKAGRVR